MDVPHHCPWSISKILKARPTALIHLTFTVGRSSSFSMWLDPWLGGRTLLDLFGFEIISLAESTSFALVRESLMNDSWNIAPSNHTSVMELRNLLNYTEISSSDRILWDNLSIIKTSDIWNSLRSRKPQVAWFHLIWHKVKVPKAAFLLWWSLPFY
ncbi:uncharacterized protein LOC141701759 [Apium graveolens]|uniref:uncharacterized protein LOC141701759 n=1 Tax=Apium graveolens TaxID=4045 RepID=UPI003D7BDF69